MLGWFRRMKASVERFNWCNILDEPTSPAPQVGDDEREIRAAVDLCVERVMDGEIDWARSLGPLPINKAITVIGLVFADIARQRS